MRYLAINGQVYVREGGKLTEATTARTSDGRDVERHHRAVEVARRQREANEREGRHGGSD